MPNQPDFIINSTGPLSTQFLARNIRTFKEAALFIRQLPHGRNNDKSDLESVFLEGQGTCSTKHALLKQLAHESNFEGLRLIMGLFKMNGKNTPAISRTLKENKLDYIPEAHCYLKYRELILDYTKQNSKAADFIADLIEETEITSNQITDFKINYHKQYLMAWLKTGEHNLTLNDLWTIREQCIRDLADN